MKVHCNRHSPSLGGGGGGVDYSFRARGIFKRRTSTGSSSFSLVKCLDATKFVLLSVFTLIETICQKTVFKIAAQDCKQSTSGGCASPPNVAA